MSGGIRGCRVSQVHWGWQGLMVLRGQKGYWETPRGCRGSWGAVRGIKGVGVSGEY